MNSLRARLLAATAIVLVVFVALTGLALERAIRERATLAQRDKLQGLAYALLGSAEITADGAFRLPARSLPEAALSRPDSGLYAAVRSADDETIWRSPSLLGRIPLGEAPEVGQTRFENVLSSADTRWLTLAFGIRWVVDSGDSFRFTLIVAEDSEAFYAQLRRFRGVLWAWLSLAAFVLLVVQLMIARWNLAPLRRLTRALADIERGDKPRIEGEYPNEIRPLVFNLNAMLASERQRLKRYRNSLGDLAHSLKTPIAVLRGLGDDDALPAEHRRQLNSQLARVNDIIDYQLQRAAAAGKRTLAPPLALRPVVEKLVNALRKVYHDDNIEFELDIAPNLTLAVESGDATEIFGNLLDNACKYGRGRVRIAAGRRRQQLWITIDDNGPGFPRDQRNDVLERGRRADTRREGQGIGLAVSAEIVQAYDGRIRLEDAPSGGGRVALHFAAA